MPKYFENLLTGEVKLDHTGSAVYNENYVTISKEEFDLAKDEEKYYAKKADELFRVHHDEEIHIFGNGPSLMTYAAKRDWSNEITIGVNCAGAVISPLKYLLVIDQQRVAERKSHKWLCKDYIPVCGAQLLAMRHTFLLEDDITPDYVFTKAGEPVHRPSRGLFYRKCSVHMALDIARLMCPRAIYLWGLDYKDRSHAYDGKIKGDELDLPGVRWDDFNKHVRGFEILRDVCLNDGVKVYNCNPTSELSVFPKISPSDVFGDAPVIVESKVNKKKFKIETPDEYLDMLECLASDSDVRAVFDDGQDERFKAALRTLGATGVKRR